MFTTHTICYQRLKKICKKNPHAGKERKAWNKPTKLLPSKWKWKLAKSGKGSYYNQGNWINENEYGKERYYDE